MPLFHCGKCHHEWEGPLDFNSICDWCGAKEPRIMVKTPMELFMKSIERARKELKQGGPYFTHEEVFGKD